MKRAALLIGVDRTGELPVLKDAAAGARRMAEWARDQKMDHVELFTDGDGGHVDPRWSSRPCASWWRPGNSINS